MVPDTEYELANHAFRTIQDRLMNPEIDLFASRNNRKCLHFVSWILDPDAVTIDAFTISWTNLKFYAFPPFCLIPRVLQKIIVERAEGIVVVPEWPTQPWYPLFNSLLMKRPISFDPSPKLLVSIDKEPHPLHRKLTLVAGLLSGKV